MTERRALLATPHIGDKFSNMGGQGVNTIQNCVTFMLSRVKQNLFKERERGVIHGCKLISSHLDLIFFCVAFQKLWHQDSKRL